MPASDAQLHGRDLVVARGDRALLTAATISVGPGDRIGLVGPNGAGKSSLLATLVGALPPAGGRIETTPADATVGLLGQELTAPPGEDIEAFLALASGVGPASAALDRATEAMAAASSIDAEAVGDEYQRALDRWLRLGGADWDRRLSEVLVEVGLVAPGVHGPDPATPVAVLSGGQRARLGLAAVLLARFDLLLLDEPTNDLDRAGLALLEAFVLDHRGGMVVVSHDRRFLERTVTAIVELDPHRASLTRYNETYQGYLEAKEIARSHEQQRYDAYSQKRSELTERSATQRSWATTGVARERRHPRDNDRAQRGFRINRTEKLAAKARQTERAIERLDVVDKPWEPWQLQFSIGAAPRSGDLVAELREATVELGSFRLGPVDLAVSVGERIVVVGENGAGKTTLLRALLGDRALTGGSQRLGSSAVVGRLEQAREQLGGTSTALRYLVDEAEIPSTEARSVLAKFGLGAGHVERPAAELSPGERTRVVLARFQATGVNTLVLDEPTNHLDLPAIEQLEAALARFEGTLLVVSHDRAFLDGLDVTRRITVEAGRISADVTV